MKRFILLALSAVLSGCQAHHISQLSPTLSLEEQNAGWKVLFDGKTFNGWRGFKTPAVPQGWRITKNGELHFKPKGGGDIMTTEQFVSCLSEKLSFGAMA